MRHNIATSDLTVRWEEGDWEQTREWESEWVEFRDRSAAAAAVDTHGLTVCSRCSQSTEDKDRLRCSVYRLVQFIPVHCLPSPAHTPSHSRRLLACVGLTLLPCTLLQTGRFVFQSTCSVFVSELRCSGIVFKTNVANHSCCLFLNVRTEERRVYS